MKWAMSYAAGLSFKFTVQIDVNCIRPIQKILWKIGKTSPIQFTQKIRNLSYQ